VKRVLSVAWV